MIRDVHLGSQIPIFFSPGSGSQIQGSKKHRIPDSGSGSATLAPPSTPCQLIKAKPPHATQKEKKDYDYVSCQGYADAANYSYSKKKVLFLFHDAIQPLTDDVRSNCSIFYYRVDLPNSICTHNQSISSLKICIGDCRGPF
jgi:hypothetical protein